MSSVIQSHAPDLISIMEATTNRTLQTTRIRSELDQTLKNCVTSLQSGSDISQFRNDHIRRNHAGQLTGNCEAAELVLMLDPSTDIERQSSTTKQSMRDFSELRTLSRQASNEDHETQTRTTRFSKGTACWISHTASVNKVAVGSIWVRSTTIHLDDEEDASICKSQTVTSTAFYPASWVQRLGITNGVEILLASGSKSWLYTGRLSLTCAIPEHSSIFELCRTGQTQAVQILLSKKLGSVLDTSPTGWKPLHVLLTST